MWYNIFKLHIYICIWIDQSDTEFGSDSDEEQNVKEPVKGKNKLGKKGKNKNDFNSIFASADEFASILDEEPNFMAGTSNAVSNKDNARMYLCFMQYVMREFIYYF